MAQLPGTVNAVVVNLEGDVLISQRGKVRPDQRGPGTISKAIKVGVSSINFQPLSHFYEYTNTAPPVSLVQPFQLGIKACTALRPGKHSSIDRSETLVMLLDASNDFSSAALCVDLALPDIQLVSQAVKNLLSSIQAHNARVGKGGAEAPPRDGGGRGAATGGEGELRSASPAGVAFVSRVISVSGVNVSIVSNAMAMHLVKVELSNVNVRQRGSSKGMELDAACSLEAQYHNIR